MNKCKKYGSLRAKANILYKKYDKDKKQNTKFKADKTYYQAKALLTEIEKPDMSTKINRTEINIHSNNKNTKQQSILSNNQLKFPKK